MREGSTFGKFVEALDDGLDDGLDVILEAVVKSAMRIAGEDTDNRALVALRVSQAAYSVSSRAQRRYEEVRHG